MNNVGKATYIQWAEEQSRLLDLGDSDSSSSPLVAQHTTAQRGLPGSPRRNGMVLDASVRSMFSMRAACCPHNRRQNPGKYQISPTPNPDIYAITGERQELIPPSLSNLSLQSASSGASWPSPSSPSSRKHSRELPFDGSPQPKRRLLAEMNSATTTFRYSAPCAQSSFGSDSSERRGGFLRRSGAPIQSLVSAAEIDGSSPSTTYHNGSEGERTVEPRGNASLYSACSRSQPNRRASTAPAPLEQREARKMRGYSFWQLTSPPIVESSVAAFDRREEPFSRESPVLGQKSSVHAAQTNQNQSESVVVRPSADPEPRRADTFEQDGGARLSALQALESTHQEGGRDQKEDLGNVSHSDEKRPITMCGKRLYSDWTGHWDGVPRRIPGAGALFPEGYLPSVGDPEPWVCPIRDCQTMFAEAWALGGHFSASHRACLLNDNLDGTMSVVGKRKTADPISGRMPPVVVSRNAIDAATAPPKATPRRPGRRKKAEMVDHNKTNKEPKREANGDTINQSTNPFSTSSNSRLSSSLLPVPVRKANPKNNRGPQPLASGNTTQPSPPNKVELAETTLWRYLTTYLPHDTRLPDNSLVRELLPLARHRDLPHRWKFQLAGGHPTIMTLCALLVYLCGVSRPSRCRLCAASADKETREDTAPATVVLPFPECIALPMGVSVQLKEYFGATACCNRFYQSMSGRIGTYCISRFSLSSSDFRAASSVAERVVTAEETVPPSPRQDPGTNTDDHDTGDNNTDSDTSIVFSPAAIRTSPGYKTALPARVAGRPKVVSIQKASSRTTATTKTKRQSSIRRLATKLGAKAARREVAVYKPSEAMVEEDQEAEKEATMAQSSNGTRKSRRLLEQQKEQPRPKSKHSAVSSVSGGVGSGFPSKTSKLGNNKKGSRGGPDGKQNTDQVIFDSGAQSKPGPAIPSQSMMMADWEIAPGRIRMGTGEEFENIAFSSSYLAQGRAVSVSDGTTFQAIEIQPGGSLRWPAEESRTRLCSVARGIIRVKLPEKEFPIGPNGMWKVKQGVACTVMNPFYLGAVVHVTTIGDEGF